jgi:hypothetical protein
MRGRTNSSWCRSVLQRSARGRAAAVTRYGAAVLALVGCSASDSGLGSAPPTGRDARTAFVSPVGNDASRCTRAEPCLSFDRAYRIAPPGGFVEVGGGRYEAQRIARDPTKASRKKVVLRPARGARVIVGELTVTARHLEVRGITATGVNVRYAAVDVTLRDITNRGGLFVDSAVDIRVLGGSVGPGVDYHSQVAAWPSHIPPRRIVLDGVLFHDWTRSNSSVHTECLQIGAGDGIVIRNSRFRNCHVMDIFVSHFGSSALTRNVTIENNFLDEAGSGGYYAIGANAYENLLIRNNSSKQALKIFEPGPARNVRMIANVAPASPQDCDPRVIYRYNVWHGAKCSVTDLNAPSGFRDPFKLDLRLKRTSRAIDRGDPRSFPRSDIEGQRRPRGRSPDAGADEAR